MLGRLWGSACTLAYLYLLARHLPGASFGRFTFYLALFMLLDSLADLGTGQVAVQRTAANPDAVRSVLRITRRIRLVSSSFGVLLVGGGAFLIGEPGAHWILLASLYPVTHVLELSTLVFKNQIAWKRPVAARAIASGLSLAFVIALRLAEVVDPALYLLAVAGGSTIGNGLLHLLARRHLPNAVGVDVAWRPLLMAALPMGVAGLCQQAYFYVDNLFVRALLGSETLGHYNVAVRVMSYGIMVAVYAPLAALPWLTREHAEGRLGPAVTKLAQPLFGLAGFALGLLWPWCEQLLALFGPDFVEAADSLRYLLLACLAVYVGASFMTAVVATGSTTAVLAIAVAGLVVNLIGNALLVQRMGMEGAALATLATEAVVAASAAWHLGHSGVKVFPAHSAWRWLLGPAALIVARALSMQLPIA